MRRREPIDPLARRVALTLGAGRVALGAGVLLATRPALGTLGFGPADGAGLALARVLGARDLALGAATLASRDDRAALRATTLAAAALDGADALAFALIAASPASRRAGLGGVASASAAALAGIWSRRRLA